MTDSQIADLRRLTRTVADALTEIVNAAESGRPYTRDLSQGNNERTGDAK